MRKFIAILLAVSIGIGVGMFLGGCEGNGDDTPCEQDNPNQGENCG